jgi:hypothetical protein
MISLLDPKTDAGEHIALHGLLNGVEVTIMRAAMYGGDDVGIILGAYGEENILGGKVRSDLTEVARSSQANSEIQTLRLPTSTAASASDAPRRRPVFRAIGSSNGARYQDFRLRLQLRLPTHRDGDLSSGPSGRRMGLGCSIYGVGCLRIRVVERRSYDGSGKSDRTAGRQQPFYGNCGERPFRRGAQRLVRTAIRARVHLWLREGLQRLWREGRATQAQSKQGSRETLHQKCEQRQRGSPCVLEWNPPASASILSTSSCRVMATTWLSLDVGGTNLVDQLMQGDGHDMALFGRWRHHKAAPLPFIMDASALLFWLP